MVLHALATANAGPYGADEREFARGIAAFTVSQAEKLVQYAHEATAISDDYL